MSTLEATEVDHYTPLARIVVAIDRGDGAGEGRVVVDLCGFERAHELLTAPRLSGFAS